MRLLLIALFLGLPQSLLADSLLGLPPLKIPADNPQTTEKIALGKRLFHDKRLSAEGTISCANCHRQDKGFSDGLQVAIGINGQSGTRNAPTVMNAAFYEHFFHDGRKDSLETQALAPFTNAIEHGLKDETALLELVKKDAAYRQAFKKVFNISADKITAVHVGKALASFERTLIGGNSAFDRYYFGRDPGQLSKSAARGLKVFQRKGNCANCHEISWNNALFTDNRFYNIGIGSQQLEPVLDKILAAQRQGKKLESLALDDSQLSELGRYKVTGNSTDIGKFKTPTLRNIAKTAPYMHDGSIATLAEVIDYYDKGGHKNPFLDAAMFPLHLSAEEKRDLEAFLRSLDSE